MGIIVDLIEDSLHDRKNVVKPAFRDIINFRFSFNSFWGVLVMKFAIFFCSIIFWLPI